AVGWGGAFGVGLVLLQDRMAARIRWEAGALDEVVAGQVVAEPAPISIAEQIRHRGVAVPGVDEVLRRRADEVVDRLGQQYRRAGLLVVRTAAQPVVAALLP